MSQSPDNAYSTIGECKTGVAMPLGLSVSAPCDFGTTSLGRGAANWVLDGLTFDSRGRERF